jgi:hypothetical protein
LFAIAVDQGVFGPSVEVSNSLHVYLAGPRRTAREIQIPGILKICDFMYIFECSDDPVGFAVRIRRLVKVTSGYVKNTLDQSASSNELRRPSIAPEIFLFI